MQSVDTLVSALVAAGGESLVLHVGEPPTVSTVAGSVTLPMPALTLASVSSLLRELLTPDAELSLDEFGAVEADLPPTPAAERERFTVVAARGGDDIWVEIRRKRTLAFDHAAAERGTGDRRAPRHGARSPASPDTASRHARTLPWLASPETSNTPAASARIDVPPHVQPELRSDIPADVGPLPQPDPRPDVHAGVRPYAQDASLAPPDNVRPLARTPVRPDPRARAIASPRLGGLERLLRVAAARGAEALYLFSQARPSVRVDGELHALGEETVLSGTDVEALLLEAGPEGDAAGAAEWLVEMPDIGRVRCLSFQDHRGPGGVFRMIPARALSAEQLGLSREIQALWAEPEGLVLVAGPRSSGKSTLIAAFVDAINRSRAEHVITLESRITFVHESRRSLVSQREVRGDSEALVSAVRAAMRENPDVLVIEDLRAPDVIAEALDAASSGHLVIGGLAAHSAAGAVERIVEQTPADRRGALLSLVAESLRGVVAQVLLRKTGGGRIAARELLLNSPSIAQLLNEGKLSQLALALEGGRRHGMVPLTDALVAFVQSGAIDAREAWRKAPDRGAFLKALRREGIDTSFAERLA